MDTSMQNITRQVAAGFAGAVFAGTLMAPRGALALPRTNPSGDPDPITIIQGADLRLDSLDVTDMGGDNWKIRATVRNGIKDDSVIFKTYPGGGTLVLSRSKGGTSVV